jgi:hypothetical protein
MRTEPIDLPDDYDRKCCPHDGLGGDGNLGGDGDTAPGGNCISCPGGKAGEGSSGMGIKSGSGGDNERFTPHFMASDLRRVWIPNNRIAHSSLSPGFYSQFDSQLHLFPEAGGNSIYFFDVFAHRVFEFVDGLQGDTLDGVFNDLSNAHAKKIELLNSSGAVVSSLSSAAAAKVTHWNGAFETFQLIDLDADTNAQQWAARLVDRKDRRIPTTIL